MNVFALSCLIALAAAQDAPTDTRDEGISPARVLGQMDDDGAGADGATGEGEGTKPATARDDAPDADAPDAGASASPVSGDGFGDAVAKEGTPDSAAKPKPTAEPPVESSSGYTPLPEGKVLPPVDPPPKPPAPPMDDADRPDPRGLTPNQFPGLLVFPMQVISGVVAGILSVSLSVPTLGLSLWAMPATMALAEVSLGDLVGQKRGTLFWPMVGAYCTSMGCTGVYGGASLILIALVAGGVFATATIPPVFLSLGALVAPLALLPVFGALNMATTAFAPAIIYPWVSEPKLDDDSDLHFPGFFSPNHRAPRAPPGTPTAAMRF